MTSKPEVNPYTIHTSAGGFKNLNTDTVEYLISSLRKSFNDIQTEKNELVPQIKFMEKEVPTYKEALDTFKATIKNEEKIYLETMFRIGSDNIATMKARLLVLEKNMTLLDISIKSMQKKISDLNSYMRLF